jgi:hypothetical protein
MYLHQEGVGAIPENSAMVLLVSRAGASKLPVGEALHALPGIDLNERRTVAREDR